MEEAENLFCTSHIVNIVLNAFSACTAIILNSLTIHAIRKTSSLPNPLKTLLLSLVVSDLAVGLLSQPLYIAAMVIWFKKYIPWPEGGTSEIFSIVCLLSYASFLGVMALSVDRFLAIHLHLRYQEFVTHKRVVAVVISIWTLSVFPSTIWFWIKTYSISLPFVVFIWSLCLISTTLVYCRIYSVVRRHTNQIQALQVAQNVGEMENAARLRKSAVSTFYVYLVFVACYLPAYCSLAAGINSGGTYSNRAWYDLFLYSRTLMFLNSSLNPVIYCWKMRHIRHTIMGILRNIFPSHN